MLDIVEQKDNSRILYRILYEKNAHLYTIFMVKFKNLILKYKHFFFNMKERRIEEREE